MRRTIKCRACGDEWCKPEEKITDVQIATQLLSDAFRGEFDLAMVISGDADIVPPIELVVNEIGLPVTVAFPPGRKLQVFEKAASGVLHIRREHLAECQLDDSIYHGGRELRRPLKWSAVGRAP